jgi:hypothetical protein
MAAAYRRLSRLLEQLSVGLMNSRQPGTPLLFITPVAGNYFCHVIMMFTYYIIIMGWNSYGYFLNQFLSSMM